MGKKCEDNDQNIGRAVMTALASHQCDPRPIPRLGVTCGLNLLALFSISRGFSPVTCTSVFSSPQVQGWRSGESTRLPPIWPGFDCQTRHHMWIELVGSLLCTERFFSGHFSFPLSSKTNIWIDFNKLKFQFTVSSISAPALERLDI